MYAIRNKKTKKWVYGTDYRYYPYHQRLSFEKALLYPEFYSDNEFYLMKSECKQRGINLKSYEIVKVKLVEVKEKLHE